MTAFLSHLPRVVQRPKKRVGRGYGSGKAKTAGRGTKGQNARGSMRPGFEGGQLPLIKRLPLLRGKGKNASQRYTSITPVHIGKLDVFTDKTNVTLQALRDKDLISPKISFVKIVGAGIVKKALFVKVPCTKNAKRSIEKAGGSVK